MKPITLLLLISSSSIAADWNKPLWTEKSSFDRDDKVFFVGVCNKQTSESKGRECALDAARRELIKRFGQQKTKLVELKTQMTFAEPTGKLFNIYRLTYVDKTELENYKKHLYYKEAEKNVNKEFNSKLFDHEFEMYEKEQAMKAKQLAMDKKVKAFDAKLNRIQKAGPPLIIKNYNVNGDDVEECNDNTPVGDPCFKEKDPYTCENYPEICESPDFYDRFEPGSRY